jgi:hypothetical protein
MKKVFLLLACLTFLPFTVLASSEVAEAEGQKWLGYIDKRAYQASWFSTAPLFQQSISLEKWQASMETKRAPLGKMVARRLFNASARKSLPGAPDGDYWVLQFRTQFEFKQSSVETVTLAKSDKNGWQAIGYLIH